MPAPRTIRPAASNPFSARRLVVDLGFLACLVAARWLGTETGGPDGGASTPLRLTERSAAAGLTFQHQAFRPDRRLEHIEPQIAATGAGVSVVDVDADGWMDVFATSSGGGSACALFRNQGDGTFRDVAPQAGLALLAEEGRCAPMGSVWGDLDNDGDQDVFVYAYGESRLFLQEPGLAFREVGSASGLDRWMNANAATFLDYDRDGLLDLYVAGYYREEIDLWQLDDTKIMHDSFEFATNGGSNRLWRNLGDGRWQDVTAATGSDSTRWTYAVAAADFDDDGWIDLYLANDYGSEELLANRQGQGFELVLGKGLEEDSKSGMSVSLGDVTNEGRLAIYVTNISESRYLFQGNNLRLNLLPEGGPLLEIARDVAADCGWAWGAQLVDLDLDGWQDLFVCNGFISADPARDYWYDMSKIAGAVSHVVEDADAWPPMEGRSLSGFERSRVLLNLGERRPRAFVDVAAEVGVTDELDGRAVAVGDLFNDGAPDVLVANQRGALLLYDNPPVAGRHWARIELVGTRSPRDAVGATVIARFGPHVQRLVRTAANGFSAQNDGRLHLGLGAAARIDRLEIRWPSGTVQVLTDLPADRAHRIVESDA